MIEVDVVNVAIDVKSKMPVIVLKEKNGSKTLPIWIGLFEAQSIALAMENVKPPRPLTHDLAKSLIEKLKGKVDRVVINDLRHNTFYARILIRQNGESIQVDSRPSDAIALALRLKVPIFIEEEVLDKVAMDSSPIGEEEIEEFKKKLKDLKPEDFGL
ncbi:bifunctional nuclease family protein [Candidatus Aerophobetes bacterium]|uniref:Bifunctional nuclease family protein n=1 Tax=Aerophobetes bacterium TaxID=2030807 RepID=A0A7V0MZM5_UNCAE|nr:bifunctional nuclease family protein [Candidatus Aerophobetes bacterium]HDN84964.1 bifunctional nuclease family protein [Candidatus Aerophobetes bacterium]